MRQVTLTILTLTVFLLAGQAQSQQSLSADIKKAADAASRYPANARKAASLDRLLIFADSLDRARITELRASGQPDIWYEVQSRLQSMHNRRTLMAELPSQVRENLTIKPDDVSEELEIAKKKAGAYLHAHAARLLKDDDPVAAREAYHELIKVTELRQDYDDLDELIARAVLIGAGQMTFGLINESGKEIKDQALGRLDAMIGEVRTARMALLREMSMPDSSMDFLLSIRLTGLEIGPEKTLEASYREVRDVLDDQGYKRDSIVCEVREYKQMKAVTLSGVIEYVNVPVEHTVLRVPVKAVSFFSHSYGQLQGDPRAASEETLKLIAKGKVDFPVNGAMVLEAADKFATTASGIILGRQHTF